MGTGLKKEDSAALKGVAILLMMFAHCFRSESFFQDYQVIFSPFTAEQVISVTSYGKICVSLFAFVTGYGLMFGYINNVKIKKKQSARGWVASHLLSTMSGYWIVAILSYVFLAAAGMLNIAKWGENVFQRVSAVAADILGLSALLGTKTIRGAWWYISAAIVFIVLAPLLAELIEKIGGTAVILLVVLLPRVLNVGYTGGNTPYPFLMAMVFGMVSCKYDLFAWAKNVKITGIRWLDQTLKFFLLGELVLFGAWSYFQADLKIFWEYCFAVVPLFVILFCVLFLFRIKPLRIILAYIGKHSLNIWLVHTFLRDYGAKYLWMGKYAWTAMIIIIGFSLAVSICLEFLKKVLGYNRLIGMITAKLK